MPIRLSIFLLAVLIAVPLAATGLSPGDVFIENHASASTLGLNSNNLWLYSGGSYAYFTGATALIYQPFPPGGAQHFLIRTPDAFIYAKGRTVSVWDGSVHLYWDPETGVRDIFTADADLTEIAPTRSGNFLVAELSNTPEVGAKLIEFNLGGVVAEYTFPRLLDVAHNRALGATHIDLLADGCTVLYTLGSNDPNPGRVHKFNICTRAAEPDFWVPSSTIETAGSVRKLPNGNVLVAIGKAIRELTPQAVPAYEWAFEGATHVALTPDGHAFYGAGVNHQKGDFRLYQLDARSDPPKSIQLGNPEMQSLLVPTEIIELVVVGEWRAAGAATRTRAVRHR